MIAPRVLNKLSLSSSAYKKFYIPLRSGLSGVTPLTSRGNRPLTLTFEHQLEMLVFYHLQGYESGAELLQAMEEDDFAREHIAPKDGIKKSAFYEAISDRGLLQLQKIFQSLYSQAKGMVPKKYTKLGKLVAVDGSLVDATLSMYWAEYRKGSNKFKAHVGFNINQRIPQKLHLTEGKAGERPFVGKIVDPGQTAILDRGYQGHCDFDQWQKDGRHFVCRIRKNTLKKLVTLKRFEMVQIFAGLITYLLMAIYCAEEYGERVNMRRVRQLRNTIQNELRASQMQPTNSNKRKHKRKRKKQLDAKT